MNVEPNFPAEELLKDVHRLLQDKSYPLALVKLRQAVAQYPDFAEFHYLMGGCLYRISEFGEARECLEKALQCDPAHSEANALLEKINARLEDGEPAHSFSHSRSQSWVAHTMQDKDGKEPKRELQKVCPECKKEVASSSWRCGFCGNTFYKPVLLAAGVYGVAAVLLIVGAVISLKKIHGTEIKPGKVVNEAGLAGDQLIVSDVEWMCTGLTKWFSGFVRGKVKNVSRQTVEKAKINVHLFGHQVELTMVWLDVVNLKPGEEISFLFPNFDSPGRALQCEVRIAEVIFSGSENGVGALSSYVPRSDTFPQAIVQDSEGNILIEHTQYIGMENDEYEVNESGQWVPKKKTPSRFWVDYLKGFVISFLALFGAALLVNFCVEDVKWNDSWKEDLAISSVAVVIISIINIYGKLVAGIWILAPVILIAQFGVLLFLYKRSLGQTFMLYIFYEILVACQHGILNDLFG